MKNLAKIRPLFCVVDFKITQRYLFKLVWNLSIYASVYTHLDIRSNLHSEAETTDVSSALEDVL